MVYGGGMGPDVHNPMALEANANLRKERLRRPGLTSLPTFPLLILLPFVGAYFVLRSIYRGLTGWKPPVEAGSAPIPSPKLRALMNDLCTGSATQSLEDATTATCDSCGKEVAVNHGKLLTHSW